MGAQSCEAATSELPLTGPERKNAIVEVAALSPTCHSHTIIFQRKVQNKQQYGQKHEGRVISQAS